MESSTMNNTQAMQAIVELSEHVDSKTLMPAVKSILQPYYDQWQTVAFTEAIEYLEFAAKGKSGKPRNCKKGYACGDGCISRTKKCRKKHGPEAKQAQEWLKSNNSANKSTPKNSQQNNAASQPMPKSESTLKDSTSDQTLYYAESQKISDAIRKNEQVRKTIFRKPDDATVTIGGKAYSKEEAIRLVDEKLTSQKQRFADTLEQELQAELNRRTSDPKNAGKLPLGYQENQDVEAEWLPPKRFIERSYSYFPSHLEGVSDKQKNKIRSLSNKLNKNAEGISNQDDIVDAISSNLNVSKDKALTMLKSLDEFTGGDFSHIRAADRGAKKYETEDGETKRVTKRAREHAETLNEFLEAAPKYNKPVYRGMKINGNLDQVVQTLRSNEGWTAPDMASYTSDARVARDFGDKPGDVIFELSAGHSGVAIKNVSSFYDEHEILMPKGKTYKINGEPREENGRIVIPIREENLR